jgi:hypothetical protein
MPKTPPRQYWLVKHGLDSLTALPHFIWRTGERRIPKNFRRVRKGDLWIGFAYTPTDNREKSLRLITGFQECTKLAVYRDVPAKARKLTGSGKKAWMIEGIDAGHQPAMPVGVPPLNVLLGRSTFNQQALISISHDEYKRIRKRVFADQLEPIDIPLLGREPRFEQEVVALVVAMQKQLGIEKILRLRNAFPDMLVKLKGRREPVHFELELYARSFLAHGHPKQIKRRGTFSETNDLGKRETRPVGLLCWIDDDTSGEIRSKGKIDRVFSLRDRTKSKEPLFWR